MFLILGNFEEEVFFQYIVAACVFFFLSFIAIHWSVYSFKNLINDVKTACFLSLTLLFLTPVLKSLTVSYSEDTIILLVIGMES